MIKKNDRDEQRVTFWLDSDDRSKLLAKIKTLNVGRRGSKLTISGVIRMLIKAWVE